MVQEFMNASDQLVNKEPTLIDSATARLRMNLMIEEAQETHDANENKNLVEVLDGCADQLYILLGDIISHGLQGQIEESFKRVHESNMTKVVDGKVLRREDGKILKPDTYRRVDLTDLV